MIPFLLMLATAGLMHAARSFITVPTSATVQLAFGYLLLTAYFTGRIVSHLATPKLTGYILAGVLSGPFVLDLVTTDMASSLKIVSGAATAIIALEAGAELQLSSVRRLAKTLRAITLLAIIGAMVVLGVVVYLMKPLLPFLDGVEPVQAAAISLLLGVVLAAQSPAVVMALLAELRAAGPLSELILASVVVADLVVIICFSIASAGASAVIGGNLDLLTTVRDVGWELFGSIAFGLVIGFLLGLFLRTVREGAPLFALAICVVVAEAGPRVHLDPLIVMLTCGLWIRNAPRTDASALISGFESAQLPVFLVFFALAGVGLDLDTLFRSIVPVAILAGARALTFFIGCRIATRISDAPPPAQAYAWIGLVPQAGLALALAIVLEKAFPQFGAPAAVIILGVIGVNQVIAPVILRAVLIRSGEAGKKVGAGDGGHH
jgi:Kef-type K+ transport system membrane component KefB